MLFMCAQSEYLCASRSISLILFNVLITFRSFMTIAYKKQKMSYFYNQAMTIAR